MTTRNVYYWYSPRGFSNEGIYLQDTSARQWINKIDDARPDDSTLTRVPSGDARKSGVDLRDACDYYRDYFCDTEEA